MADLLRSSINRLLHSTLAAIRSVPRLSFSLIAIHVAVSTDHFSIQKARVA